jgi:hypothetical protein
MMAKNKLYIKHIGNKLSKTDLKEILYLLIPHITFYTPVSNVTFNSDTTGYTYFQSASDAPLPEPVLQVIYSKGYWAGKQFALKDNFQTVVTFKTNTTISIEHLFVYENALSELVNNNPEIFQPANISHTLEDNLYTLIGIFVDLLVDKTKEDGNSENINKGKFTRPFKSQKELMEKIEEYDIRGYKSSSLEEKFSKANRALKSKY